MFNSILCNYVCNASQCLQHFAQSLGTHYSSQIPTKITLVDDVWWPLWPDNKTSISNTVIRKCLKKHALHSVMWVPPQQKSNSWTIFRTVNTFPITVTLWIERQKIQLYNIHIKHGVLVCCFHLLAQHDGWVIQLSHKVAVTYSAAQVKYASSVMSCAGTWDVLINGWIKLTVSNLRWWAWGLKYYCAESRCL